MKIKNGVDINDGNDYKKHYNRWNIYEFKWRFTEEEALEYYKDHINPDSINYNPNWLKLYPNEKVYLRWWRKRYKNK